MTIRRQIQVIVWRWHAGRREYLLLRREAAEGGFWQMVTGGIDPGETPEQTARREVREETGLAGTLVPTGITHRFHWVGLVFEERLFTLQAAPGPVRVLAGEHDAYRWCSLAEALWLMFWPKNREHLWAVDRLLHESSVERTD